MQRIILIALTCLLIILGLIRVFHIVDVYSVPTLSMEPNYKAGDVLLATCLKSPDYNDVVAYKSMQIVTHPNSEPKKVTFLGRVVAQGNDTMKIIDGFTFVNGRPIDKDINLKFNYIIHPNELELNREILNELDAKDIFEKDEFPVTIITISPSFHDKLKNKDQIRKQNSKIRNDGRYLTSMSSKIKEEWSMNNLGPLIIPDKHYFILGDNRNKTIDSRMRGFISEDDIVSTVIE